MNVRRSMRPSRVGWKEGIASLLVREFGTKRVWCGSLERSTAGCGRERTSFAAATRRSRVAVPSLWLRLSLAGALQSRRAEWIGVCGSSERQPRVWPPGKEVSMQIRMKDLTVELSADRPGTLATAFEAIANANINVDGFAEIGGTLHLLTRDAAATRRALESGGFRVTRDDDVVVVDVVDRPGAAANIFRQLGDADVNVTFAYVATGNRVTIGAANITKAAEIVSRTGAA